MTLMSTPYLEFKSVEHALAKVSRKLNPVLDSRCFYEVRTANIIYIDGCHDYEIVSKDWLTLEPASGNLHRATAALPSKLDNIGGETPLVVAFVDFFIRLLILVVMMAWYKFVLAGTSLLLPFFVAVASLVSLAPGLWITALNVKYRDFRFVTPFLSRPSWYLCLAHFGSVAMWYRTSGDSPIPQSYDRCHRRVPLVHPWRAEPALSSRFWIVAVTAFLLGFGIRRFRKMEKSFADII